jgi:hypothetical protein
MAIIYHTGYRKSRWHVAQRYAMGYSEVAQKAQERMFVTPCDYLVLNVTLKEDTI